NLNDTSQADARAFLLELRDSNLHANLDKSFTDESQQINVTLEDIQHVSVFINAIRKFIEKYPREIMELEYDGNKLKIDQNSIYRAEMDIQRLMTQSFSISGSNIVIGSNNQINPSGPWPRHKK